MTTVLAPKQANLTVREMEVIEQLCLGKSNKQIAWDMAITERTVKAHLTSTFAKTGTKNRVHLVLLHLQS
jgi:DNA-binding CsgD family transcriptional regulator